jgi:FeS assembly SUF system regulator
MLRITKKVDYAILILAYLTSHQTRPNSAREIAETYQIPRPVVANLLKTLAKAGLIVSQRGNQGGYLFVQDADELHLADILRAVDGEFAFASCSNPQEECPRSGSCPAEPALRRVHRAILGVLESVSIAELAGKVGKPTSELAGSQS